MKEDKGNVGVLNDSILHVLKEHCGIGVEKQKVSRKRGRKITPGERIVSLGREDAPGSSKENVNPLSKRKKNNNKNRKKSTQVKTCGFVATGTVGKSGMTKAMIAGWFVILVVIDSTYSAQELNMNCLIIGT